MKVRYSTHNTVNNSYVSIIYYNFLKKFVYLKVLLYVYALKYMKFFLKIQINWIPFKYNFYTITVNIDFTKLFKKKIWRRQTPNYILSYYIGTIITILIIFEVIRKIIVGIGIIVLLR